MLNKLYEKLYKKYHNRLYNENKEDLYRMYKEDIRKEYIDREFPLFLTDIKDKKIIESLADLYESESYKILVKLLCNYKNRLGQKLMKVDSSEVRKIDRGTTVVHKYSDKYWRGFYGGQAHLISYIIALVNRNHKRFQEEKEKK